MRLHTPPLDLDIGIREHVPGAARILLPARNG
jgi:hypothetical protein